MKFTTLTQVTLVALFFVTVPRQLAAQNGQWGNPGDKFQLTSSTFENNTTLPLSTLSNITVNGVNGCSVDGSPGGNQSPELSWTHAHPGTRSFIVVAYDVTAAFTHWGMYNISHKAT